jgi:hypothetical protein
MERTKSIKTETTQSQEPKKYWFRKVGGGSFAILHENGKKEIIKPNQKFQATMEQIPKAFKDVVLPLENIPSENKVVPQQPKSEVKLPTYSTTPHVHTEEEKAVEGFDETVELWDIVDMKGKVLNGVPLKKENAEQFVKDLMD